MKNKIILFAFPVLVMAVVLGIVAAGFNGGLGLPSKALALNAVSGGAVMTVPGSGYVASGSAVLSGTATSGPGVVTSGPGAYETYFAPDSDYIVAGPSAYQAPYSDPYSAYYDGASQPVVTTGYDVLNDIINTESLGSQLTIYPVHCLVNPVDGSYFFTDDFALVAEMSYAGWGYEGVSYYAN